jgi:hypothetical protein
MTSTGSSLSFSVPDEIFPDCALVGRRPELSASLQGSLVTLSFFQWLLRTPDFGIRLAASMT